MEIIFTDAENKIIESYGKQLMRIEDKLDRLLAASAPKPKEIIWPYGNWGNSKYTFPNASEVPALDIRDPSFQSPYIQFKDDGSITFNLPDGISFTPTKNAKNPRMERREYKDMKAKTNYRAGDMIRRDFATVFHALNFGKDDVVFSQVHGEEQPYFKIVAGKDGIRVQCKTRDGLSGDDVVKKLLPHADLKLETAYRLTWAFDGRNLAIQCGGGPIETIIFNRTDEYYPKDGAYGPLGARLSHMRV